MQFQSASKVTNYERKIMEGAYRQSAIMVLNEKIKNFKSLLERLEKTKKFLEDQGANVPRDMEEVLWSLFISIKDRI